MDITADILNEMIQNLNDFKTRATEEITRKRAFDADTLRNIGMLTLYIENAVSNISATQSLFQSMTAPADEAETGEAETMETETLETEALETATHED